MDRRRYIAGSSRLGSLVCNPRVECARQHADQSNRLGVPRTWCSVHAPRRRWIDGATFLFQPQELRSLAVLGAARHEVRILEARLPIVEWRAVELREGAARGGQDRVPRCGIPLHCRSVPRIKVGLTSSNKAELQRGACGDELLYRIRFQVLIRLLVAMRAASHGNQAAIGRRVANTDGPGFGKVRWSAGFCFDLIGAAQQFAKEQTLFRGSVHDTPDGLSIDDLGDVHRELAIAADELLRAVQRIDKKEA